MAGMPVSGTWRKGAVLMALALAMPRVGTAGELRVLLEGEAGMFSDGDYHVAGEDPAPLRNDDSRARAGLNLQLSYALERVNLAMAYAPAYERSLDNSDLSGITHRLDFGLIGDLSRRLQLDIRERLLQTPDLDLYAPATAPDTTTVTRRGDQLSHALDVTLNNALSRRASLTFGASHSLRKFEEEDLIDSEALGARIGSSFEFARAQRLELNAGVGRYDYKERGQADVETFGVAWSTGFWRSSHLRLEAGAFSVDSTEKFLATVVADPGGEPTVREVAVKDSAEGFRGGLQLSQERQLVRWALGLSHDVSPGAGLGRAVEADNAFLGFSFPIGRRLELGLDGSGSRQRDLTSRDRLTGLEEGENDSLTEFAAGTARASWTFAQAFRIEGGYSRVWQRSRVAAFGDLNYARYFLNLAFRLYQTGETPKEPESLGRPTDDAPDSQ